MTKETQQLVVILGLAAVTFAACLIAGNPEDAVIGGGLVAALGLGIYFGRDRLETAQLMSGSADERVQTISMRATAFVGNVYLLLLPALWLVSVAKGESDDVLALLCFVGGVAWVAALLWLRRRS